LAQPHVVAQMAANLKATAPPAASKAVARLLQEICRDSAR